MSDGSSSCSSVALDSVYHNRVVSTAAGKGFDRFPFCEYGRANSGCCQ